MSARSCLSSPGGWQLRSTFGCLHRVPRAAGPRRLWRYPRSPLPLRPRGLAAVSLPGRYSRQSRQITDDGPAGSVFPCRSNDRSCTLAPEISRRCHPRPLDFSAGHGCNHGKILVLQPGEDPVHLSRSRPLWVEGQVLERVKRLVVRGCDHMTVVSRSMRSDILKMNAEPQKISVIPMGVELREHLVPPSMAIKRAACWCRQTGS